MIVKNIYGIEWLDNGKFFKYTDKFLSDCIEISEDEFEDLCKVFNKIYLNSYRCVIRIKG